MSNKERKTSQQSSERLSRGDVVTVEDGFRLNVQIPEKYVYSNTPDSDDLTWHEITVGRTVKGLDTSSFAGEYVVVAVEFESESTGHGPNDVFPAQYKIRCQRLHEDGRLGEEVYFYQALKYPSLYMSSEQVVPTGKVEFLTRRLR